MWLLIDDVRDLKVDVIARTAEAGKKMLSAGGWECVCFDHDLGEVTSGYDVLVWAIENDLLPPRVQLVTSNPVGRSNMAAALGQASYLSRDNINYTKVKSNLS